MKSEVDVEVTKDDLGVVITSLMKRIDEDLFAMTEDALQHNFHFRWDESASLEWNTYKFSDALEHFKRSCRRWEEHHHGSGCVVERVRDKYIMPKVREFLTELAAHNNNVPGIVSVFLSATGVGEWCAPGPASEQVRKWILWFEDTDRGYALYDNEEDARLAFAKAEATGWNCHLFQHAARVITQ